MNNERYNQIIDEAYENYKTKTEVMMGHGFHGTLLLQEEFISKCKTDVEFSERWNLFIEETYDLIPHSDNFGDVTITKPVRRNKLIVVYKNETIEVYE